MSATATARRLVDVRLNAHAVTLMALFTVVITGALAGHAWLTASGVESAVSDTSTGGQAAAGAGWAIAEAAFAGGLLGALALWKKAPAWIRAVFADTLRVAFWIVVVVLAATFSPSPIAGFVGALAVYAIVNAALRTNTYWLLNNIFAVTIAAGFAAYFGVRFGPILVGVGLIGLSLYDYWFADRNTWMFDLVEWAFRWRLPALVVMPMAWRFDWEELIDVDPDSEDDDRVIWFGIGMADLFLPAAFAVGIATTGEWLPVGGAVAGVLVACLRLSAKQSGAGLPPLAAGSIGGYAIGATVVAVSGLIV